MIVSSSTLILLSLFTLVAAALILFYPIYRSFCDDIGSRFQLLTFVAVVFVLGFGTNYATNVSEEKKAVVVAVENSDNEKSEFLISYTVELDKAPESAQIKPGDTIIFNGFELKNSPFLEKEGIL